MNLILQQIKLFLRWLRFYQGAQTIYDVHSPFLFTFTEKVVEDRRAFYAFGQIETLRKRLLQNSSKLDITDLGAGSLIAPGKQRTVRSLARHSAVGARQGQTLFRLVHLYKPSVMLELGTSLGLSTLYQAMACRKSILTTVEGCPALAEEAEKNLRRLDVGNVQLINAGFEEALPRILEAKQPLDYLYLDGDHRKGASLRYFEQCLERAHADSVFVIADIYWSAAMQEAWQQMKSHPRVTLSVDLFHFGVLFFRTEQIAPQHIKLVPARFKPWHMGFFG